MSQINGKLFLFIFREPPSEMGKAQLNLVNVTIVYGVSQHDLETFAIIAKQLNRSEFIISEHSCRTLDSEKLSELVTSQIASRSLHKRKQIFDVSTLDC